MSTEEVATGNAEAGDPVIPIPSLEKPPSTSHGAKDVSPYTSGPNVKKTVGKKQGGKSTKHGSNLNVIDAKKFLKKDHHDSNMVVAVRIRPLSNREIAAKDFEVVQP